MWLQNELIRPHLHLGDCLLFDTRVLHFGLGNYTNLPDKFNTKSDNSDDEHRNSGHENSTQSNELDGFIRPMLYVNHHYTWFHDRKNWNTDEPLFECNVRK